MTKLILESVQEFENLFNQKDIKITNGIVYGIRNAIENKVKTAYLFEIRFQHEDTFYEITLPRPQWKKALTSCIKKYEEQEMWDDAIDTYNLTKVLDDHSS